MKSLKERIAETERVKVLTEQQLDSLHLDLKQQQESFNQEKLMQIASSKSDKDELIRLNNYIDELNIKLNEKISEINELSGQIVELNENVNRLKQNDSYLSAELEEKTNDFVRLTDRNDAEISKLKLQVEEANEQRKQFEFVVR